MSEDFRQEEGWRQSEGFRQEGSWRQSEDFRQSDEFRQDGADPDRMNSEESRRRGLQLKMREYEQRREMVDGPRRRERTPEELVVKDQRRQRRQMRNERIKQKALDKTPDRLRNPSDFQVRFRTGFVYIAISVICILGGDIPTMLWIMAVSGICAGEFYFILRADTKLPNEALGIIGAILYPVGVYWLGLMGALLVTVIVLLGLTIWYVFWMRSQIGDVSTSFFGAAYTGLFLSGLLVIRHAIGGIWGGVALLLIFVSVEGNNVAAYLVGSKWGKHKLAPRTSPKKSWEGFIAGLLTTMVVWIPLVFIPGVTMDIAQALAFGLVVGLASVLGDLAESRIKRGSGVKDSGTIMPGHGGLFDRCDSLFLASIASVILLGCFGCIPLSIC